MRKRRKLTCDEKLAIFVRDHWRCCKCNKNLKRLPKERRIDHKIPFSKGGSDDMDNLQLLCAKCDTQKADNITPDVQECYIKVRLQQLEEEAEKRKKMFFNKKVKL